MGKRQQKPFTEIDMTENPSDVIAYQWVINQFHPDHERKVGSVGPIFDGLPYPNDRWGLDQIWHLRNGQKIIARKKAKY